MPENRLTGMSYQEDAAPAVGVYVHIPFCHHRCTYCDFNIYAGMRSIWERYAQAVAKEIASAPSGCYARTIYFGGGTPSLAPIEHIGLIVDAIRAAFEVASDAEITLEANPRTEDDGYFERLRALGVNRLSLGMQSAHARDLHLFRRGHTFDDVARTFRLARAANFDNLNLDLIYGIPGQSLDDWRRTLDAALALGPEHVSAYGLQVEDGTTLKKWLAQGKLSPPDDDLAADMFDLVEAMLEQAGFVHYEISNWARGPLAVNSEQLSVRSELSAAIADHRSLLTADYSLASRHNLIYWRNEPYLGFGCGAHSWFDGRRFAKVKHPREYIQAIEAGRGGEIEAEQIGRELEMGETMMVGLRLLEEGVTFDRFTRRFGVDLREVYGRTLERLQAAGLIELTSDRLRLSRRARLIGNQVFGAFLTDA